MTAQLGVNVGAPDDSDPSALQATGATWTRTVYRDNIQYRPWLLDLLRRAIANLFVGDSSPESLGEDESQWRARMTEARDAYGDLVKWWSWGNEPDWHGIASWTMDKDRVNRLLEVARDVFPAGQYTLVSPGLVSGQPGWLEDIRLDLVDAVDVHPYSKFVSTPAELRELEYMLSAYRDWWGKPLWLGEYDSRTDNLSTYFRTFPGVERAAVFCWDSGQTAGEGITGMGIRDNPRAMAEFVEATASQPRPPTNQHATFQHGFKQIADRHPDIVGSPRENESGPWQHCSLQRTDKGWMVWGNFADGVGDQKGFVAEDLTRYVWNGDRLERR